MASLTVAPDTYQRLRHAEHPKDLPAELLALVRPLSPALPASVLVDYQAAPGHWSAHDGEGVELGSGVWQ